MLIHKWKKMSKKSVNFFSIILFLQIKQLKLYNEKCLTIYDYVYVSHTYQHDERPNMDNICESLSFILSNSQ